MPNMTNPQTGETRDVDGPQVQEYKNAGWEVTGGPPEGKGEHVEHREGDAGDAGDGPSSHETSGQFPADEVRQTHEQ
jgi:hypothetical protein